MKMFMEYAKKAKTPKNYAGKGKQTVKQLVGQGQGVTNIEISDKNIKDFESIARKYGVDFAVIKDATESPPKHLVFFKAHDTDAIASAFKEYSTKQMEKSTAKPSLLGMMRDLMEKVKNQVLDQTKHKDRGRDL
jgi:phosphoribosylformylglycinamidine (FGAM) synthase-like enzyme